MAAPIFEMLLITGTMFSLMVGLAAAGLLGARTDDSRTSIPHDDSQTRP